MVRVSFQTGGKSESEPLHEAPVKVFDGDLIEVGTSSFAGSIQLNPGLYAARATLPDGSELCSGFEVLQSSKELNVELKHGSRAYKPTDIQRPEVQQKFKGFGRYLNHFSRVFRPGSKLAEDHSRSTPQAIAILSGNPFVWLRQYAQETMMEGEEYSVQATGEARILEIGTSGLQSAVPASPIEPSKFKLVRSTDGTLLPDFLFDSMPLRALMQYMKAGRVKQARELIDVSEQLPSLPTPADLTKQPILSLASAYAQMGAGNLQQLLGWSEELPDALPWSSDALVIRAELCARAGRHDNAAQLLTRIPGRGLPLFAAGVSYAASRLEQLRQSSGLWDAGSTADPAGQIRSLSAAFDWLSRRQIASRPILTFRPPALPPNSG